MDGFIIESGNTVADNDDGAGWWDGSSYAAGMLDISHVIFRNNIMSVVLLLREGLES